MSRISRRSSQYPNLSRKKLREYSYTMAKLNLPKELEDYLLDIYNEEDFLCDDGNIYNYSEEDVWYGVRDYVMEYACIKKQVSDLLDTSQYLGHLPLTIKVQPKPEFLRTSRVSKLQTIVDEDYPF